jgi:hypothetical protein
MDELTKELRALRDDVKALREQQAMPELMTPEQCARFLNRSDQVLYEWRRARLAGVKSGPPFLHITSKTILYDRADVLAWVREHRVN